jgi:hypothetical protein
VINYECWTLDLNGQCDLIVTQCHHPDSNAEGYDIDWRVVCKWHERSIWWCVEERVLWCDGGPPDYPYHNFDLVARV